jgi:hypothetical protein
MNPPSTNMIKRIRDPAVLVMTTVLHMPATTLNNPPAACWIKKTVIRCLKNLQGDEHVRARKQAYNSILFTN